MRLRLLGCGHVGRGSIPTVAGRGELLAPTTLDAPSFSARVNSGSTGFAKPVIGQVWHS
jgi:hypothetical protein